MKLAFKGQHQVFLRYAQLFPNEQGYLDESSENSKYIGDPSKLYMRYKYNFSNKLAYGITAEKDAGEAFFKGNNKAGFDFYSGHIFFRTNTIFKKVAIGDYQLNLGQGLLAWTGFGTGKSSYTMNVKKTSSTIKPYSSVDEFRFYRGAATTIVYKQFEATPFVSIKKVDANVSYSDSAEIDLESVSLQVMGLHRNANEIDNKNALLELKVGAALKYGKPNKFIALNTMYTWYDKEVTTETKAYNSFKTIGKAYTNLSLDYNYLAGTFLFFGENAVSITNNQNNKFGYGLLNGVLFSADKKVDFALLHRYYDKKFVSGLTTNAFAESTTANNEHGLFIGTEIRPLKYFSINAYADIYQFPWLRFQTSSPSVGTDFLVQFNYKPNKVFETYFRYKNERKIENTKIDAENGYTKVSKQNQSYFLDYFDGVIFEKDDFDEDILKANASVTSDQISNAKFLTNHALQSFRLNFKFNANKDWSFQTRADFTIFNDEINGYHYGFLAFQDIAYKSLKFPVSFNLRLAYFDIQDWDARIYAYESDVLYQFSIPAYQNRGFRTYFNARYTIYKGIDFWVRYALTYYTNLKTISTGTNAINGNQLSELKAQLRFQF